MLDLLGDPVAPTPPMDAPLPWRVYRLNDCDWWVARSLEEAKADYIASCGGDDDSFEDPHELTDAELDRMQINGMDENERLAGTKHSFREELKQRVAAGLTGPAFFASTEY